MVSDPFTPRYLPQSESGDRERVGPEPSRRTSGMRRRRTSGRAEFPVRASTGMRRLAFALSLLATAPASFSPASASGADGSLLAELNKLESSNGDCHAYLVTQNRTEISFAALKLDIVIFDTDEIVVERLAVDAAPLPPGKTYLQVFETGGLACERIGRLLLNDVIACADDSGTRDDCLALVVTRARGSVDFIL